MLETLARHQPHRFFSYSLSPLGGSIRKLHPADRFRWAPCCGCKSLILGGNRLHSDPSLEEGAGCGQASALFSWSPWHFHKKTHAKTHETHSTHTHRLTAHMLPGSHAYKFTGSQHTCSQVHRHACSDSYAHVLTVSHTHSSQDHMHRHSRSCTHSPEYFIVYYQTRSQRKLLLRPVQAASTS